MLIAIDGACKRNGDPTCSSSGVAWIQTEDGNFLYKTKFETQSTSQRGELNGLLEALKYAVEASEPEEDVIIITDSEYIYNAIVLDWCFKWAMNNWVGGSGPVKNVDLWCDIVKLLSKLDGRVFFQWTKGHLISYSYANIKAAIAADPSGIELFTRIQTVASRLSERSRIISDFQRERKEHGKPCPPDDTALEWAILNTVADCLASYVVQLMDALVI
jgi:ribonuclease HI